MSRTKAFQTLDTKVFVDEMREAGVYCPSACETTLDESPEAYKPADDVLRLMDPTVDVIHRLKPIWNFKASGKRGRR